jgi:copper chaperone
MTASTHHQFTVTGMSCQHCVKAVTQAIQTLDPQARVSVTLENGDVQVDTEQSREEVAQVIAAEGYGVAPR